MPSYPVPRADVTHQDDLSPHDLRDTTRRWRCECGALVQRLPTGRLRYHGATVLHPQACSLPQEEWDSLSHQASREALIVRLPHMAPAYVAILARRAATPPKRPHGGQLRHPSADGKRWGR